MSLLAFFVAIGAIALMFAAYFLSIRRLLELPLDGIEQHPIYTADGWRVMLYRHRRGESNGEPVLLVHGYCSNHWNLTAPRGESLADYLADAGYDCWAIDLRGARSSVPPPGTPRHRATFDGYVMQDLPGAIEHIRRITGHDQVHWVGHSLGGTLLYAHELAHGPARIASGTTIASPPVLRPNWPAWQSNLIRLLEVAPGPFAVFQRALAPIHASVRPRTRMVPIDWDNLNPKFGVAEFFSAVETPAGPVTRVLEECAKHRYLAVDNDRVNVLAGLNRLTTPLLVFGCPLDPIVPVSVVRDFVERLPGADKRFIELSRANGCERDHDHIDPPFARHAASEVFIHILEWMKAHPVSGVEDSESIRPAPVIDAVPAAPLVEAAVVPPNGAATATHEPVRDNLATLSDSEGPTGSTREAPLWGRALQDAASMLGGLDTAPEEAANEPAVPIKRRSKRRGGALAAKRTTTKRRVASATPPKRKAEPDKSASEKPRASMNGRMKNKAKSSKKKSKSAKAAAEAGKKEKKKRDKSKDKSAKKKSKGKKASRK